MACRAELSDSVRRNRRFNDRRQVNHANTPAAARQHYFHRTFTIPFITDLLSEMKPLFHLNKSVVTYSVHNEMGLSNDSRLVKPLSHRIVRLLDRTIGCYLANVRPIGNVCYDRQQRSHTAIGLSFFLVVGHRTIGRTRGRANNNDW